MMFDTMIVFLFVLCAVANPVEPVSASEKGNVRVTPAQQMLARLDQLHQQFWKDGISALLNFPSLFIPDGTWLFPVGQDEANKWIGRAEMSKNLKIWADQLIDERSYMIAPMSAGNSAAYFWRDVYTTSPVGNSGRQCMFTHRGFNQLFVDERSGMITNQSTWTYLQDGSDQNVRCGLDAIPFAPPSPFLEPTFEFVTSLLQGGVWNSSFASRFAADIEWWEPVGVSAGKLQGKNAVTKFWDEVGESFDWSSVVLGEPMYSGNNLGFHQVATFRRKDSGCVLSVVDEFVSVTIDSDSGLITQFNVYYDQSQHDKSNRCGNNL